MDFEIRLGDEVGWKVDFQAFDANVFTVGFHTVKEEEVDVTVLF